MSNQESVKSRFIPQIQPWIDEDEWNEVRQVIESTYITENKVSRKFEAGIKDITGARHAITTTSGTTALYCALKALNIGPGDEVIVPDLTFIASSNAVIMAGAKPVFCDVKSDTLCIDTCAAEASITQRTKAIMPVHLYGQSADMQRVNQLAQKYGLKVIEDAAEAIGVHFENRHVGLWGDAGVISFYGNKTVTCGEGGIVLTNDDVVAQNCRRLKNHGRDTKGTFIHEHIGFNFAITDMQAAIGIAQLRKFDQIVQQKQKIFEGYSTGLSQLSQVKLFPVDVRCQPVYWFTTIYAENRSALEGYLADFGIQTRPFFYPLHLQPCYREWIDSSIQYPVTLDAYQHGLALPSAFGLTQEDQDFVIRKIHDFYEEKQQ